MKFTYSIPIDRPAHQVWETVGDAERVMRSIPGCEEVRHAVPAPGDAPEDGVELYQVRATTSLGPVRLHAAGTARVRRDPARCSMEANISMSDQRAGSAYGTMALQVRAIDDAHSELHLEADVVLAGKIGEFAQPVLRHKADQTVREFARNLIGPAG